MTATCLSPAQRARDLAAAAGDESDVLVIGAGVTGAGAALDAAARGLRVTLVEAGDIACGTSSRSGKTFHGGLRYLEQLNFHLVAEAIAERDLMLRTICPHIAWPEAFVYPLTSCWERPYVGAGVALYDLFGLKGRAVPRQRHLGRAALKQHMPALDTQVVVGGIEYYDALMDDARHTLAVVRTAAGLGARVLTAAPVVAFIHNAQGHISGVEVCEQDTGTRHTLRARAVINAGGVWADDLQRLAGGSSSFRVQPAKGVHLLLPGSAIDAHAGLLARASDSVIIARRWYGYWLVGTTDTPWNQAKGQPVAERADIVYLLDNLNRYLARKVHARDVLGVYAGLRPLLKAVEPADGTQAATSALLRDHAVLGGPPGLTTIVGGKYTTYRRMARDAVDAALKPLGIATPSTTATLPLLGAARWAQVREQSAAIAQAQQIPEDTVRAMLARHGDRVDDVLALARADPRLAAPLPELPRYLLAELPYAAQCEGARTLYDVLARRLHLALELPDGGAAFAPQAAELVAPALGWSAQQCAAQVQTYRATIAAERAALEELQA